MIIQGNKGSFQIARFGGFVSSISEEGVLTLNAVVADGSGSSAVLTHEQKLDIDLDNREHLEGHAREIALEAITSKDKSFNAFKFAMSLERISLTLSNPDTDSLERLMLTLPEGTTLRVQMRSNNAYGAMDKTGPRYMGFSMWQGALKSPYLRMANLTAISLSNQQTVLATTEKEKKGK